MIGDIWYHSTSHQQYIWQMKTNRSETRPKTGLALTVDKSIEIYLAYESLMCVSAPEIQMPFRALWQFSIGRSWHEIEGKKIVSKL